GRGSARVALTRTLACCWPARPRTSRRCSTSWPSSITSERAWRRSGNSTSTRTARGAAEARETMDAIGIKLVPFASWDDPDKVHKLHELNVITVQDVPHSLPIIPEAYADFEKRVNAPDRPHDRLWVALQGNVPVGMSDLKFPPVRGTVWTGYTCSH